MKLHTKDRRALRGEEEDDEAQGRSFTFAIVALSHETPEHLETMMAIGRLMKVLLGEEMSVVLVGLLIGREHAIGGQ